MNHIIRFATVILFFFFYFTTQIIAQTNSLPYIMDMVYNNPGEKPFDVKFNDPEYLKAEGYNSMAPAWHINCYITYDNLKKNIIPRKSETRKWIDTHAIEIDKKIIAAKKAGIALYPFTDFLVLPKELWHKYGEELKFAGAKAERTGESTVPDINRPMTQQILRAQIAGIFDRFPQLDGIMLRFGETYLHDTPHHTGSSPVRTIEDHIVFINILREEICVKRNKKLFYRTWDFGYSFHNNGEFYLKVTDAIEPHPNLIFSIKYPQNDFLRMSNFNPALGKGKHQQLVEAQSAMEAYGKGAHPYYTAGSVIDGFPETKYLISFWQNKRTETLNPAGAMRGIKELISTGKLVGVWTWSSGGGWQGPYLKSTIWKDLNSYVISNWGRNPSKTEEQLCYEFAQKHGIEGFNADIFRKINVISVEAVRKGQCSDYTKNNLWWARDNFFSASYNNDALKEIVKDNLIDRVLAEKAEAAAMWSQIEALSKQFDLKDKELEESLRVGCTYGRIKYHLTEQMWYLMIQNELNKQSKAIDKVGIKASIARYDALWAEWRELAKSPWCATLYKDTQFLDEHKGSIGEMVDGMRKID